MIGVFDRVARVSPSAGLTVYVDDSTIECAGTQRTIVEAVIGATVLVCSGLEERGITFSQTKNVVIASRKVIGKEVQEALGSGGGVDGVISMGRCLLSVRLLACGGAQGVWWKGRRPLRGGGAFSMGCGGLKSMSPGS